jgi:uncharacterized protein
MLESLVADLQQSLGIVQKQEIQVAALALRSRLQTGAIDVTGDLGKANASAHTIRNGDDCAAIADGDGYLLLAAEGMSPSFVERDPWFAGWCAVMVNVSDVAAMGGWPIALVDAIWSPTAADSQAIWAGMIAAAAAYDVPIVGGHTNCHSPSVGLAAAILGRAKALITSFDACPGDRLLVVTDLRGEFYQDYPFWNAATEADPVRLRGDLALLPDLAQAGLCSAGKDISMAGLAGTLLMLLETSGCGAVLELEAIAKPSHVPWDKWLISFPSFGYVLAVAPAHIAAVMARFRDRDLSCVPVGIVTREPQVYFTSGADRQLFWDLQAQPLTGFSGTGFPENRH